MVTPCVGVWIEIISFAPSCVCFCVTPCVGVWIEIGFGNKVTGVGKSSLPAWECGLKSWYPVAYSLVYLSLPAWECGLKSLRLPLNLMQQMVTPCVGVWIEIANIRFLAKVANMSLPAWECGLKSRSCKYLPSFSTVTPCVGVWIEIMQPAAYNAPKTSLPAWECGLK